MWKFQGSIKRGAPRNWICSQKNFIWCLRGRGLGAKQFITFSLCIKKTKKVLHIDLTYYQGNKMYTYTALCVVQSSMQLQQKDWNKYVHFQCTSFNLKSRRQKTKSTYFANNQRLWIKFNFDSQKIKDLFGSDGIQQKQPSRGVLRKRCSENMQQIYRRISMSKCELNKLHFGMGVLLYIKFAACIFPEHVFLRTPLDGCFWYRLFSTLCSQI